jgi:hypothetical protein
MTTTGWIIAGCALGIWTLFAFKIGTARGSFSEGFKDGYQQGRSDATAPDMQSPFLAKFRKMDGQ